MNKITLKNFRCFREEQTTRLAPLTLLVGENSTGKTSFMAMLRALWDIAYRNQIPDFKEEPYDLGSFDEIAHYRGGKGGRADTFQAAFTSTSENIDRTNKKQRRASQRRFNLYNFEIEFEKRGTAPYLRRKRLAVDNTWIEYNAGIGEKYQIKFGTPKGIWGFQDRNIQSHTMDTVGYMYQSFLYLLYELHHYIEYRKEDYKFVPLQGREQPCIDDLELIEFLVETDIDDFSRNETQPYASAPVRSKPHRTYDPARPVQDPEGDYIPMYLANTYFQDPKQWKELKMALEKFGQTAGLFDELSIKPLGKKGSEPFQVQIRKFGKTAKGPRRNLIDVGYGVSQVLPVVTELLRHNRSKMFLLQQPEVHLHPSAQAALGTLFCQLASPNRQLIVETHSDHLLDRVRMDVRDGSTPLKPDDVSILFFERGVLDVTIHSLRLDQQGNILNTPPGYRRFFMEETQRSLGY